MAFSDTDAGFMSRALELAAEAEAAGEVPVGAVVVHAGEILGEGGNRVIVDSDPSAHAEMVAIRDAARRLGNYRLPECELYVTLEPCTMCAGAIVHARLRRVVFAAHDPKTGAAGSVFDVLADARHNHVTRVESGLLAGRSARMLKEFFEARRGRNKEMAQ